MRLLRFIKRTFKRLISFESVEMQATKPRKNFAVAMMFIAVMAMLLGNIAVIQFIKGDYYQKLAYAQQNSWRVISASRGSIKDCNGIDLAISVSAGIISVNPETIRKSSANYIKRYMPEEDTAGTAYYQRIARKLSELLELDYDTVYGKVTGTGRYQLIAEKVEITLSDKVAEWISTDKIKGVYVDDDVVRVYPNGSLACHIIGFTGRDDQGLVCGVELALDDLLTGTDGRVITAVDASGNELPFDEVTRISPVDGYDAVLTIDANIQRFAEDALSDAMEAYGVQEGGTVIVMNAKNADVLAMASNPYFNLSDPYAAPSGYESEDWNGHTQESVTILSETVWRNKALTDTYEPGSTFKTITAAVGLEENAVTLDSIVSDSPLTLSGWTIHCWRKGNDHGSETFADAVKNSCNPVMARVALDIGIKKYYEYIEAFGFRNKTGILLSGEASSIFHDSPSEIDMAVAAFGQRFQITPIQLATAYCAIANGGTLMQPRIVKELIDKDGVVVKSYDEAVVRQVISEETSKELLATLEKVVAEGTGSNGYVSGYRVAGKTGTSETTETDTTGRYVVSFASIAPADDPEIVVLVVLDHPTIGGASGGLQAAPLAANVIEKTLDYLEVERRYTDVDKQSIMVKNYVPDVSGMSVADAIKALRDSGFSYTLADVQDDADLSSINVEEQIPHSGAYITDGSRIVLYSKSDSDRLNTRMPDLRGYTLEDAYETLTLLGINMQANNIGVVVSQSVAAGTNIRRGSVVVLDLVNNDTETAG